MRNLYFPCWTWHDRYVKVSIGSACFLGSHNIGVCFAFCFIRDDLNIDRFLLISAYLVTLLISPSHCFLTSKGGKGPTPSASPFFFFFWATWMALYPTRKHSQLPFSLSTYGLSKERNLRASLLMGNLSFPTVLSNDTFPIISNNPNHTKFRFWI